MQNLPLWKYKLLPLLLLSSITYFLWNDLISETYSVNIEMSLAIMVFVFITAFVSIFRPIENENYLFNFIKILFSIVIGILTFALVYGHAGILNGEGNVTHSAVDSLYFSIVTWTTLGYGDFQPTEQVRMYAAFEALLGTIFSPIMIAALIIMGSIKKP